MSMELKQQIKMAQQLRMTPQLQQAIKLLQLSKIELVEMVQQELVENPVLEELPQNLEGREAVEARQAKEAADSTRLAEVEVSETNNKSRDEIDWEAYLENYSAPMPANSYRGMQDDLPGVEATLSEAEGLVEHLLWQLNLNAASEQEQEVGELIIGNLDENGFLVGLTIEEIAERAEVDVEYAEGVLEFLQEFDPVGVCARDIRETLLIQAKHYYPDNELLHAIVERHLENLQRRNVKGIIKDTRASEEEIIETARLIASLDPRPGSAYATNTAQYITPDIYVHKVGEDYLCTLNDDGLPKLKVSDYYRKALGKGEAAEAKNYIQDKLRSASWLIRSIAQRQRTILRVTESIVRFQREFLDHGVAHLKPLVLRDIAEDIGVHESTVSRVTTNKYVHTPQGIFELKYFFNSSIQGEGGDNLASEAVKSKIRVLVGKEDPKKPYSDQKLVELLKDDGVVIARRTVAKYREAMGILPSSKRKRLF